jgi:hypothetical protein
LNELIDEAFKSLSTACNISSLHTSDEDLIKVTLKALHNHGVVIDVASLESWLTNNHWQETPINSVVTWAKAITTGGGVRLKHKNMAPTEEEVWQRLNA